MLEFYAARRLGEFEFDVRFTGPPGGVTVLFGPSGSGKSTALALLAGALAPDRARIVLDGRVLEDSTSRERVPMEARQLGWVFQDGRLFPHLTVAQNLEYGAKRAARHGATAGLPLERDRVLEVLGIAALLARRPRDLSGGERQRVALGRALLAQPKLLLLDEPLASLDAPRRLEILGFIDEVKREFRVPMVYVTHSLAEVVRLADELVLLDRGRVAAAGEARALLGRADLPALARRADAGALIEGVLVAKDPEAGYASVALGDQTLAVPDSAALGVGERVRLYILSSDVIVAAERPARISVRNVLACRVGRIVGQHDANVLLELELDSGRLLATLTRAAFIDMGLAPGSPAFALVKSVAIDAPAGRRLIETGG